MRTNHKDVNDPTVPVTNNMAEQIKPMFAPNHPGMVFFFGPNALGAKRARGLYRGFGHKNDTAMCEKEDLLCRKYLNLQSRLYSLQCEAHLSFQPVWQSQTLAQRNDCSDPEIES